MTGASSDGGQGNPSNPPEHPNELGAWIRGRLGRRLTVVVVTSGTRAGAGMDLCSSLASQPEARVARVAANDGAERTLAEVARVDPDVVLIWLDEADADAEDRQETDRGWAAAALAACEQQGLLDRAVVVLTGPDVTRAGARALGFEDGIASGTASQEVMRQLAHEAVARDELRRHGSSPPCYL